MKQSTLRRFLLRAGIEDHLALHQADCLASNRQVDNLAYATASLARLRALPPETARLFINGDDLLSMGFTPGPLIGAILRTARNWQDDGEVADRDQMLARIRITDWSTVCAQSVDEDAGPSGGD